MTATVMAAQLSGHDAATQTQIDWTPEERQGSLAARFERVVREYPEALAVKSGERIVRYAELNAAANRIAHALLARLGPANVPVASLLSDRMRMIPALLGMLKSAKIYTPLAPDQPPQRLRQILDDSSAQLMLVDAAHRPLAAQLGMPDERLLDLDALDPSLPAGNPGLHSPPGNFVYIIYTSGSTGRPKGVAQKQSSLLGSVLSNMREPALARILHVGARALLATSPGYSVSVLHTLLPLVSGATVCPFALEVEGLANLRDFLLRERINRMAVTASTFRHFMATLRPGDCFPDVTYVALFGEPMLRRDFEFFKRHFGPDALLMTGLGSTEAGSFAELVLTQQSVITERIVPVGYVTRTDLEVFIADEQGRRVGPGTAGEITLKSRGLSEYWRSPELNARAFMPDPEGSGMIVFRTGDLGLMRADGMLEHRGRKDFQVKVRGSRVELGEIEMALFELGSIREAVVVAQPDAAGETQLIAYVVPEGAPAPALPSLAAAPGSPAAQGEASPGSRITAAESANASSPDAAIPPMHTVAGEPASRTAPVAVAPAPDTSARDPAGLASGAATSARPTASDLASPVTPGWLRRHLASSLPAFMVPAAFVILPELPLTASGKIDRARLPAPALTGAEASDARDALEAQLAQRWAELLHLPHVGRDDDFFDLGGNSLLAMQLFADIQQTLGRALPLSVLFQSGTVAELAGQIRAAGAPSPAPRTAAGETGSLVPTGGPSPAPRTAAGQTGSLVPAGGAAPAPRTAAGETGSLVPAGEACLVPIQPRGSRRPFFLAAGGNGGDAELLIYARLARFLSPEQPFYGLRARSVPLRPGPNGAVEAIAAGHLAEIRAVQPHGPYLLGGECIGGVVAVEMARQLRAQGEEVALLCLLDTQRPAWPQRLRERRKRLAYYWQRFERRSTVALRNATRAVRRRPLFSDPPAGVPSAPPNHRYSQATMHYRPQPSAARITLLVNEQYHRRADPSLGWQELAIVGIEVHALPGTHETYIRQNVQAVGECLRARLEQAQRIGGKAS